MHRPIATLAVCVLVGPVTLFLLLWWPLRANGLGTSADFITFYGAGKLVREGQVRNLYDYSHQLLVQQEFTSHQDLLPFIHPPFEVWLFLPLTYFSFSTAYLVWTLFNLSVLGFVLFLLRPHSVEFGTVERLVLIGASFYPALTTILQGQDSFWVLLAYTLAYISLRRKRDFQAGCFLTAGLLKFQIVLPFVLIFLLIGRFKFVYGFLSGSIALVFASVVLVGPRGLLQYARFLSEMNSPGHETPHIDPAAMPNLRGISALLLTGRISPSVLTAIIITISLFLIVWMCRKLRGETNQTEKTFDLKFALMILVTLLTSYYLFLHDLSPLILVAFLILNQVNSVEGGWSPRRLSLVLPLLLFYPVELGLTSLGLKQFSVLFFLLVVLIVAVSTELSHENEEHA
jgi:hypothetical protein